MVKKGNKMKNLDKIRSKYYTIELYDDSENLKFIDKIEKIKQYDYAYIKHDKDGSKEHYHVVVAFNNYRYLKAVADEFEIPYNYIEEIRSLDAILMYLIHLNDKSKYQYDINDIIASEGLYNKLVKAYKNNGQVEEDKILDLIEYINRSEYISYLSFIRYACTIGRYDIVRRSQYLFIKIIDEHNNKVMKIVDDIKLSWYN